MKQAIAGVTPSQLGEVTSMVEWPTIAATVQAAGAATLVAVAFRERAARGNR